jgi:hypothetical protein
MAKQGRPSKKEGSGPAKPEIRIKNHVLHPPVIEVSFYYRVRYVYDTVCGEISVGSFSDKNGLIQKKTIFFYFRDSLLQ